VLLVDATPLQSEHRLRGVGAYLRELIGAFEAHGESGVKPHYLVTWQGLEHVAGLPRVRTVRLLRPHTPAQVYWLYNEVALRTALFRLRPRVFFAPDFNGLVHNPFGGTVAVLHDLTALKLARGRGSGLSERLSELRWRRYYAKLCRTRTIIAISGGVKDDAVTLLGIPPARVTVVHHGVDHRHYHPSVGAGPFAEHPPYFVAIGARNDNKNQGRLLRAFARVCREPCVHHSGVKLLFAGPWGGEDLAWLERERRQLGLGASVQHIGYVPYAHLPSLYGNALAFVFPSLEEGFGLPVLEAMASGAPVITSERPSLREVAGDAALLVDPLDEGEIARALHAALERPELRTRLREAGYRRAQAFTWAKTAEATLAILRAAGGI